MVAGKRRRGGFRPGEDINTEAAPAQIQAPPPPAPPSASRVGLSFSPAADARGTADDILMGYRVFLGRDPENAAVIEEARHSPVGAFIRALMVSHEFQDVVLDRLAGGPAMPHEQAGIGPTGAGQDWLFGLVAVPPRMEAVLRATPDWAEWFRILVALPGFPIPPSRPDQPRRAAPDFDPPPPDPVDPDVSANPVATAPLHAPDEGRVLITIESPAAGEPIPPGSELAGSGWVIAPAEVAEVAIHLDGTLLCYAAYGNERPDVARNFPAASQPDYCGFKFAALLPPDASPGGAELAVRVRLADGQAGEAAVRLGAAQVAGAAASDDGVSKPWPIRLMVDQVVVDAARRLWVSGWALTAAPFRTVTVALGGAPLGAAVRGLVRIDVARLNPGYPDAERCGWTFSHQLDPEIPAGPALLRVQAEDADGQSRHVVVPAVLPVAPVLGAVAPDSLIEAACDAATQAEDGRLRLNGWARAAGGITVIRVAVNGVWLGDATLVDPRPDLLLPAREDAHATGFEFTQIIALPPAEAPPHTLRLHLTSRDGSQAVLQPPILAHSVPRRGSEDMQDRPQPTIDPVEATRIEASAMRLEVDVPRLDGAAARDPVRGALTISGWAIARQGVERVDIRCDGALLGRAYLGMRREDIAAAFPDHEGALLSGYALVLPPGTLPDGRHAISVTAHAAAGPDGPGPVLARGFDLVMDHYDTLPPGGAIRTAVPPAELAFMLDQMARHGSRPTFVILVAPIPGTTPAATDLDATLRSLAAQAYPDWTLKGTAKGAPKSRRVRPPVGDFTVLLRPGDRLGADALLELAAEIAADRNADFIYADELRADAAQSRRQPFFKPDWSPNLLLAMNYVGRPWCARADLVARAGVDLAAAADYDAVLRLTEHAGRIVHVARVLCDRGAAEDDRPAAARALAAGLARRGIPASPEPGEVAGTWRVRRAIAPGRVSVIMPTCGARNLVRTAIRTIRATSAPALAGGLEVEIVVLDNTMPAQATLRAWIGRRADVVVDRPGAFNWSAFNNAGAAAATGEYLLFLNDDIEAREPGWLEAMVEHAQRPDVGVVGARLLYPDGKVQHGGQYLSDTHARHAFRFADGANPGPFGLATVAREMISVTGACQMVRASVFADLGGFDEAHDVVNNDLDFCLRSWQAGLAVVFTPYATLVHHELASRATLDDTYDARRFAGAWRARFLAGDPFRNPHLRAEGDHYGWEREPAVLVHAGRRGPAADSVRRILALKLDHIGDFLTALPALRSLARRFPAASIDLLAPAATAELARDEPVIAQTIVFDFFHARSGEGARGVGKAELQALAARLAPAAYDIAIDLRMHPDTRAVLPHTGAKFLAGYDHANRFDFLDLALEWEGDTRLVYKRAHVSERLVQLVAATEAACRQEQSPADAATLPPAEVPALARLPAGFLDRPIVCVHPGVGNPVRQWPPAQFAGLVDLLTGAGLHVVLVGAPAEASIAEDILARVTRPQAVHSLVGRVKLDALADVMRACVLFVGNNSGPQHLAAMLGLPAIGIHSGVVDATEWAPLGSAAVAIRRRMACSPCYLEFASDCPRNLACLTGLRPADVFAVCRRMLAERSPSA